MSIRVKYIHFPDWAKVIEGLKKQKYTDPIIVSNETEARTFLKTADSTINPFYYFIVFIKSTKEIYTHGEFYDCSYTDSSDIDQIIEEVQGKIEVLEDNKVDSEDFANLVSEVEENEEVAAAALTSLHETKVDKSELPDFSDFATKTDLNTKQDLLVSGANIKTINNVDITGSGNIETLDTKVTSASNHYKPETHFTKSGITTGIKYDEKGHVTEVETRSLTSSDIPEIDASKITSGTISIDRLPHGALERLYILTNRQAAIEHSEVSEGDTIMLVDENNTMYFCVNNNGTTFDEKFIVYTAAAATSVSWEGITGKPDLVTQDELNVVKEEYLPLSGGTVNGNIVANDFITTSDERLKDFESDVNIDFDKLKSIPKKYYYWKDKSMGKDLQMGTSAQALAKIYPECVNYDEVSDRYSVNYQKLSIVALAAIDKLHEEISKLKSMIND